MKLRLAALALCLPPLAWSQAPAEDPLAYLGWMKDLAGSCWQGRAQGRPEIRTSWTRQGPDGYRAVRERREAEAWKEIMAVDYRRVPR
ncbi:MAG: hypothetical protein KIS74_14735 [Burkholderiales bacterium]|nr:hypothetical protein [Burkholderiales bacterium]